MDLDTGKKMEIVSSPYLFPVGWSPSGKLLLFNSVRESHMGEIWISDTTNIKLVRVFSPKEYPTISRYFMYNPVMGKSHDSYWLNNHVIIIAPTESNKKILFDIETKQVLGTFDGYLSAVSPTGEFWIEKETIVSPDVTISFLSGEKIKSSKGWYSPSPDGKKLLHVEYDGNKQRYTSIIIVSLDKNNGMGKEHTIATLPENASVPIWSSDSDYLLYAISNSAVNEPPFHGWCEVISAVNGKRISSMRCDYGGGFASWSPKAESTIFGTLSYERAFTLYDINTGKQNSIEGLYLDPLLDLSTGKEFFIADWSMVEQNN